MYSTGTLHLIGGNTTCRATSVSDYIVKEHKRSHFTCGNYICSDTVFSEARVMELIDGRETRFEGTFTLIDL